MYFVSSRFCLLLTSPGPVALLLAAQNTQQPQKQVDDIHVQRRRRVDGIVHGFGNAVRPRPIVADIAAKNQHDDPINNRMVRVKDKDHHQFDDDGADQGDKQAPGNAFEKAGYMVPSSIMTKVMQPVA